MKETCFVMMPFAAPYQSLYDQILKPAIEQTGLTPIRADEVFSKPQITHEIWSQLRAARCCIADLTGKNPNVLYEVGLAHAIGKPTLVLTRNEEDVPFDLRALRYLYYDTHQPFWGEILKDRVSDLLRRAIANEAFGSVLGETNPNSRRASVSISSDEQGPSAGQWHGVFRYANEAEDTTWSLRLAEIGGAISGTLVVSTTFNGTALIGLQAVSGVANGRKVRFDGKSVVDLCRRSGDWVPDSFVGSIATNGKSMKGTIRDEDGQTAHIVLRRVPPMSA